MLGHWYKTIRQSRHDVPVLCKLLEPWQGARKTTTDYASHCRAVWAPCNPTSTISGCWDTASMLCFPVQDQVPVLQMGGLVGWGTLFDSFLGFESVSSGLWAQTLPAEPQGPAHHPPTHTHIDKQMLYSILDFLKSLQRRCKVGSLIVLAMTRQTLQTHLSAPSVAPWW